MKCLAERCMLYLLCSRPSRLHEIPRKFFEWCESMLKVKKKLILSSSRADLVCANFWFSIY
ncbi:MAG: hypothetical protein QW609_04320 [Candidatus Aenigmatarchaeota archaeon]